MSGKNNNMKQINGDQMGNQVFKTKLPNKNIFFLPIASTKADSVIVGIKEKTDQADSRFRFTFTST